MERVESKAPITPIVDRVFYGVGKFIENQMPVAHQEKIIYLINRFVIPKLSPKQMEFVKKHKDAIETAAVVAGVGVTTAEITVAVALGSKIVSRFRSSLRSGHPPGGREGLTAVAAGAVVTVLDKKEQRQLRQSYNRMVRKQQQEYLEDIRAEIDGLHASGEPKKMRRARELEEFYRLDLRRLEDLEADILERRMKIADRIADEAMAKAGIEPWKQTEPDPKPEGLALVVKRKETPKAFERRKAREKKTFDEEWKRENSRPWPPPGTEVIPAEVMLRQLPRGTRASIAAAEAFEGMPYKHDASMQWFNNMFRRLGVLVTKDRKMRQMLVALERLRTGGDTISKQRLATRILEDTFQSLPKNRQDWMGFGRASNTLFTTQANVWVESLQLAGLKELLE